MTYAYAKSPFEPIIRFPLYRSSPYAHDDIPAKNDEKEGFGEALKILKLLGYCANETLHNINAKKILTTAFFILVYVLEIRITIFQLVFIYLLNQD